MPRATRRGFAYLVLLLAIAIGGDLVEDRRCGLVRHHLRRLYPDPITRSQEWGVVADGGMIRGVYGLSSLPPVRHVEGVKHYFEWRFVAHD